MAPSIAAPTAPTWKWPRLRARPVLLSLAFSVVVGLSYGTAVRLDQLAYGSTLPASRAYVWELTGALCAWLSMPLILAAGLNAPSPRVGWARFLGLHALGYALYGTVHILLMMGTRAPIYWLMGWGAYDYGPLAFRLPMELQKDLIVYVLVVCFQVLLNAWREQHARTLRAVELEGELREARLQALTGQLQPHFLFNALNTVSSVMYEDLARTDKLLSDLGQLLRASLERREATWTLAEERAHTERFVSLVTARFGERVVVRWDIASGLEHVRVPSFALQSLVENAVKHNEDRREPLEVRLRARSEATGLRLEVEDTGRGFGATSPARGHGVGLSHLERVLALLHDGRARMERGRGPEGGARVTLCLPRQEAA
ncbi:histidine kinase [Myxococcus sp. K15C18031901]|uniref:sensor histidine kinase n=1 Tax=Myxococcus dinghuensis TaxID=2906761 RepID=UPI0020A7F5D0|nr:histidine kinase [Myxococcus dinghuensis]MCP3100001.1 histidine kinase [Myxococcus dinghuensis]